MKKLTLREIQLEELDMLKKTVDFFEKNNIMYFLSGGTMLGAIRHKGFIPWDDDIDIIVPRPDYNKLLKLMKNNQIDKDLEFADITFGNTKYPFGKIINKKILIKSKSSLDKNLWIDIFPIDGIPDDDKIVKKMGKKILLYRGLFYLHTTSIGSIIKENKSIKNKIIKIILKPVAMILPLKFIGKKMRKIAEKYDYNDFDRVAAYSWGIVKNEIMPRSQMNPVKVDFESEKFNACECYKIYLTNMFGDYMKLPALRDRKTHYIDAYKMDD